MARAHPIWGGLGIALLLIGWEAGHRAWGSLVLPGLGETAAALGQMIAAGKVGPALLRTAAHAGMGWLIAALAGGLAGTLAGLREEARLALQPVAMILLGVPAIAWVVLALLWFGGGGAVIMTVALAIAPIVFVAAVQGARTLDGELAQMARAFRAPLTARLLDVHGPHMLSHLAPALTAAFAMSWKVAVMAELFAGTGGIGDGLATARARVDTAATMAWIVVIVAVVILFDQGVLRQLQARMERWRGDERGATR